VFQCTCETNDRNVSAKKKQASRTCNLNWILALCTAVLLLGQALLRTDFQRVPLDALRYDGRALPAYVVHAFRVAAESALLAAVPDLQRQANKPLGNSMAFES